MIADRTRAKGCLNLDLAPAIADLDAWLETMRQPGGYGGPVAHWWRNCYRYAGPGLDWRYEGILFGYAALLEKTGDPRWRQRINRAAADLVSGQQADGTYRASRFEMNPGVLGTPHEAAATLGLLRVLPYLECPEATLHTARANLENLIRRLWNPITRGFDDRPGIAGRVPNKLATLAAALMSLSAITGDERLLEYARAALDDVLRYQVVDGALSGAVHQFDSGSGRGDGRFFPYYNARCVPPLVQAALVFREPRYTAAAAGILEFLRGTMHVDGSWPQIVYMRGQRAEWLRWIAGSADIVLAFASVGAPLPERAVAHVLAGQLPNGGFRTAHGFAAQGSRRLRGTTPDYRDVTPVVGWNDKVLRLLALLHQEGDPIPATRSGVVNERVSIWGRPAIFSESSEWITIAGADGREIYHWNKREPWARVAADMLVR